MTSGCAVGTRSLSSLSFAFTVPFCFLKSNMRDAVGVEISRENVGQLLNVER